MTGLTEANHRRDLFEETGVDEGVQPQLEMLFLQLVVDGRAAHARQTLVVDDLDPLPLFHPEDDQLADNTVRQHVILQLDGEVIEKTGSPQPAEVREDDLFGVVVIQDPAADRRLARSELDVVDVGLRINERRATLRLEAERIREDNRGRAGWRQPRRLRDLHATHGREYGRRGRRLLARRARRSRGSRCPRFADRQGQDKRDVDPRVHRVRT